MKSKNLNLALAAILIAAGGAFASARMVTLVDVYVSAQTHDGDNFFCKKTTVQCDKDGTLTCFVTVPKTNSPGSETVAGRDVNCVVLKNSTDSPITASWATGVSTPFEVQ